MAFGRKAKKKQVRRGTDNPSGKPQATDSQAQPTKSLPIRPPPVTLRKHDDSDRAHNSLSGTEQPSAREAPYSSSSGWGHSIPSAYSNHAAKEASTPWQEKPINQDPALYDLISSKLDAVITSIDSESFNGDERELGEKGNLSIECFWLRS